MVTLKDISKICNVSVATVSLVLNNKDHRISKEKVELIKKTAKELNYESNTLARAMVTNKTGIIALLIPDINNPFFSQVAQLINKEAMKNGYNLFLGETSNDNELTLKLLSKFASLRVDGIILTKSSRLSAEDELKLVDNLKARKIPVISIDSNIESGSLNSVLVDHETGAFEATDYLISLGHTKICAMTGPLNSVTSEQRLNGYKRALEKHGIKYDESLLTEGNYTIDENCSKAVRNALDNDATAIFCFNDMMAVGIINECSKLSVKVPNEISVIGFDDSYVTELVYPKLTTVSQPIEELAIKTIEILHHSIQNKENERQMFSLKPSLVIRNSVKEKK